MMFVGVTDTCEYGWGQTTRSRWCGVVGCGVVRCGGVWCNVVWCGVVWCGVALVRYGLCLLRMCGTVWCGESCDSRRGGCLLLFRLLT